MSSPALHSVHFYEDHEALIDRLCGVVCAGLLNGSAVVIVATKNHRLQLAKALALLKVDVKAYTKQKRLQMLDAQELLSTFMGHGGQPDYSLFRTSVGSLVVEAKAYSASGREGATVFGEMVAILWEEGNKSGALALERLWNDLLDDAAFHLHCAYPRSIVSQDALGVHAICESHSHILGILAPAV
jgi:hypothetical protein